MIKYEKGTFGYDYQFLKERQEVVLLSDSDQQSCVLISPQWQGRVMTSSSNGMEGISFGWINYKLIESGIVLQHMNAYGGEERLWFGPEGGQFSLFFQKGKDFTYDNWFVPKELDTEPFTLLAHSNTSSRLTRHIDLVNYSGMEFNFKAERMINLLSSNEIESNLDIKLPENINVVAYHSINKMTNTGQIGWNMESGMPSLWMLSMLVPSPQAIVVIPYRNGNQDLRRVVNDAYFEQVSSDRLIVENGFIFFKADGRKRCKIGLNPERASNIATSYNATNQCLTILQFNKPEGILDYVNSMWELQDKPFRGDVIHAYNDGPLEDGTQMGPFYELESSSPAANLKPGETLTHVQNMYHFVGDENKIDQLTCTILGLKLVEIKSKFK